MLLFDFKVRCLGWMVSVGRWKDKRDAGSSMKKGIVRGLRKIWCGGGTEGGCLMSNEIKCEGFYV